MQNATCSHIGCARPVLARGMCNTHYKAWYRENRAVVAAELAAKPTVCSVDGCTAPVRSRGWCRPHYRIWLKTGDALSPPARPWRGQGCSVDGCEKPNSGMGLCAMHAYRLKKRGSVGGVDSERVFQLVHGTHSGYKHRRCRCDDCREARRLAELEWRAKNRERVRQAQIRYRQRDPERFRAYRRKWKMANPDKLGWHPNRTGAPFDAEAMEFAEIIRRDPCVYCGSAATEVDHIDPVSRSRNSHWTNLTPACDSCNSSKGAKPLLAYLIYRQRRSAAAI